MDLEIKLIITAVQIHGRAKIRVIGDSMRPLIKSGQEILIEKVSYEDIRVGDVVAYQNRQHNLVVHQVLYKAKKYVVAWGVNNNFVDPPVLLKSVLGRVPVSDYWSRINLMYLSISKQIADRFESQKIKYLFLKGAPYQQASLNFVFNLPISDVDLLIDRTKYVEVKKILYQIGFRTKGLAWVDKRHYQGSNPRVSEVTFSKKVEGIRFEIDLHLSAVRSSLTARIPLDFLSDGSAERFTDEIFEHVTEKNGWKIMTPTWQLIYLLLNMVFHHAGRGVKGYAQIANLIGSQKIDWIEFRGICKKYGVGRCIYLPLIWVKRLFKVSIPNIDGFRPGPFVLFLNKLVLNRLTVLRPIFTGSYLSSRINLLIILFLRFINRRQTRKHIAIVQDALLSDGGSERVVMSLSRMYPDADIYTFFANKKCGTYLNLAPRIVRKVTLPSFLVPYASKLKPLAYLYWQTLDLSRYDIVISSSHSYSSKNIITKGSTRHICYCHTPPRYLYPGLVSEDTHLATALLNKLVKLMIGRVERLSGRRPDLMVANSKEVSKRIKKYYGRSSLIVYPPVERPPKRYLDCIKKDYYVYCGRLVKPKFVDLAIRACRELGRELVIIGDGSEGARLRAMKSNNIKFLGEVPENEKWRWLAEAKGFIFPAKDEDFGIAPVEAMMVGTPVIAFFGGGPKETVINKKTGLFFYNHSVEGLKKTILKFEKKSFRKSDCMRQANKFGVEVFESQMRKVIQSQLKSK